MSRRHRPLLPTSPTHARTGRRASAILGATSVGLLVAGFIGAATSPAIAADAAIGMGTAGSYAVLAGSTVTNTGASVISGDLGLSPGSSVTGFPPGQVVNGTQHVADAVAISAQNNLTTAYNDAAGRPTSADVTDQDLGGMTLTAGVYEASTAMALTGTVTLNAQGNPSAVFIFKAGSTLTAASNSRVQLVNGASPCNVFWQVGSSATVGTSSQFVGTIMALTSATLRTTATLEGRVLARNGAVTLDTNVITAPNCAATTAGSGGTAGSTSGATATGGATSPVGSSTGKHHGDNTTPGEHTTTPVIPTGHPSTGVSAARASGGAGGGAGGNGGTVFLVLAGLAGVAALIAALIGARPATIRRR